MAKLPRSASLVPLSEHLFTSVTLASSQGVKGGKKMTTVRTPREAHTVELFPYLLFTHHRHKDVTFQSTIFRDLCPCPLEHFYMLLRWHVSLSLLRSVPPRSLDRYRIVAGWHSSFSSVKWMPLVHVAQLMSPILRIPPFTHEHKESNFSNFERIETQRRELVFRIQVGPCYAKHTAPRSVK